MELINVKELINNDFPVSIRSQFVPTITKAYIMADTLLNDIKWLDWPVGYDLKRYLRRVAVEFELVNLFNSKELPIRHRIASNSIDNCNHIELITDNFIGTINQVASAKSIPRSSIFRNHLSLSNQGCFDFENNSILYQCKEGPYFIILTHGYYGDKPDFVCLGVPEPHLNGWVERINLLKEPYLVELPETEYVSEGDLIKFKEHILKGVPKGETV